MKTFSQLDPDKQNDIFGFNQIHFDLSNLNAWLNNPALPHTQIADELDEFLIKLYKRYEDKNPKNSQIDLENS